MQLIRNYMNHFQATYVLFYGVELGLFDAMKKIGNTFSADKLAMERNYYTPFVEYWCRAAYAIGVLDYKNNSQYAISNEWLDMFTNSKSNSYARFLPLCHIEIAGLFSRLKSSFKTGKTFGFDDNTKKFIKAVEGDGIRFTNNLLNTIIPKIPKLEKPLRAGATILDIGCGTANNLITLAKHFPKSKFIGVDISEKSICYAKEAIRKEKLTSRISVHCECASKFLAKNEIDVITFIESLHEINVNVREKIFHNAYQLLKQDGILVVIDCITPDKLSDLRKEEYQTAAIMQWFEMTWGTSVPKRNEVNQLLTSHHFTKLNEIPIADVIMAGYAKKEK